MIWIKKLVDLILYGNFWIAAGALAMSLQSQWIIKGSLQWDDLQGFVFFSTLLLYALHRIVGILRLKDFLAIERYRVIARFRHHIMAYALLGALASIYFFFQLSRNVQLALVIPAILSLGYVLPLFGKQRRLRDFNQIKIFLVAGVWAGVTVLLPALEYQASWDLSLLFLFLERCCFVFAITLPFDIRDLKVDGHSKVLTIPAQIGIPLTQHLAAGLIGFLCLFAFLNWQLTFYSLPFFIGIMASGLLTLILIYRSRPQQHDYFYSGLIDGTMILQFLLAIGMVYLWN